MEIQTYEDIDIEGLWNLGISDLRSIAYQCGVKTPLSKGQGELVNEITKIVEREIEFYDCSCSARV